MSLAFEINSLFEKLRVGEKIWGNFGLLIVSYTLVDHENIGAVSWNSLKKNKTNLGLP